MKAINMLIKEITSSRTPSQNPMENRYEVEWCSSSAAVTIFLNNHPNIEIISITCSRDNYSEHFYVFYKKRNYKKEKSNNQ